MKNFGFLSKKRNRKTIQQPQQYPLSKRTVFKRLRSTERIKLFVQTDWCYANAFKSAWRRNRRAMR